MKLKPRLLTMGRAFTRVELVALLGAGGLLVCLSLPGLANQRGRFDRVGCVNNLRMIGQAFHAWGSDHGGQTPWRTPSTEDGTRGLAGAGNAWFQFMSLSNRLASPKLLICPADAAKSRSMATNWGLGSGGFLNVAYRNNSLSYLVGLEAGADMPVALLSGDRDITSSGKSSCGTAQIANAWNVTQPMVNVPSWTGNVHELGGNVLLNDGRVLETTNAGLRYAFKNSDVNGSSHFLFP